MPVALHPATSEDAPVLERLLELHQHDLSTFTPAVLDEAGRFGYPYLGLYWTEADRHALLIRADGHLAGFALVNTHTLLDGSDRSLAEFFVARPFRRTGVGREAASAVCRRFPGRWEIRVQEANAPAHAFW
ncbi:MAG: GNAT family N-acetyltransferase, partial [Bacteroidota bacterium]